jgi:hypothetical protein
MMHAVVPLESERIAADVVDVLGGFCMLERRSPTLSGSVPVRVAQACVPLLEGNGFGWQVVLQHRIDVRRRFGRWSFEFAAANEVGRRFRAALPMLSPEGLVAPSSEWSRILSAGLLSTGAAKRGSFLLFTGLFVRPRPNVRIRQSSTKNRRSLAYSVREAILDDPTGWTPIVLEIVPRIDAFMLTGEIATLGALAAEASFRTVPAEAALDVIDAHLAFYDRAYFETKRGGAVSRKYRRESAAHADAPCASGEPRVDLVEAGPLTVMEGRASLAHRVCGRTTLENAPVDRLVVTNAVGLTATYDGLDVAVEPDGEGLREFASRVRARWKPLLERAPAAHEGALLYLTKYVTPHPRGEPHFFVKPSALVRTPPGTSLLLEGASGDGFEIMRGVVETDRFHAVPAVFQLTSPHGRVTVPSGAPLLELFPFPRELASSGWTLRRAGPAADLTGMPS